MIGAKITVFDPKFVNVLALDVGSQIKGVDYAFGPNGCAAATLYTQLTWTQAEAPTGGGNWALGRAIVEISPAVDVIKTAVAAGASKIYVGAYTTAAYDATKTFEKMQIAIDDGTNATYRIPVTGVGTDGGGQYILIGTPMAGGGNVTSLPAYAAGATIYLRRYCGRIAQRQRENLRTSFATLPLVGIGQRLAEANGDFAFNYYDAGLAIYQAIYNYANIFTDLDIVDMPQVTIGTPYTGSLSASMVSDAVSQVLASLPIDTWTLRVGADRVPNLIRTFNGTAQTYLNPVTLPQSAVKFVPRSVQSQDQDTSQMANTIKVIGDTDPQTQQPVQVVANDAASVTAFGEIDSYPNTATGVKDATTAENVAQALLNQNAYPRLTGSFALTVRNDNIALANPWSPNGCANADPLYDFQGITVAGFNESAEANMTPDSGLFFASGPTALWSTSGSFALGPQQSSGDYAWKCASNATGSASSDLILCAPGQTLLFTGVIDMVAVSAGINASWSVVNAATGVAINFANGTPGSRTTVSFPVVVPAGVHKLRVVAAVEYPLGTAAFAYFYKPMLSRGSATTYVRNNGAETIYGLPSQISYTLQAAGDRVCSVTFAPVVPNINATMRQIASATAAALLNNTRSPSRIDSYCVSVAAESFTYNDSSLVLALPTYLALFAQNTAVVTVAAANVTLTANQMNYVWLTTAGTYTVKVNDPTRIAGAILIGNASTDATGISGFFFRAPIGITLGPSSGGINLVRDSNFDFVTFNGSGYGTAATYWKFTPALDGVNWLIGHGGNTDPVGVENFLSLKPPDSGGTKTAGSETIQVIPGAAMTISGYIDGTHLTTGSPLPAWNVYDAVTNTLLGSAAATIGSALRCQAQFTVPGGTTSVYVQFTQNGATFSGGNLFADIPQLEYGSVMSNYRPGTAALPSGTQGHTASSAEVQSVILPTGTVGHGQLNVNPTGGVANNLPFANHASQVSTAIDSSGTLIGIGGTRAVTGSTGSTTAGSTTNATLVLPGYGNWYLEVFWNVAGYNIELVPSVSSGTVSGVNSTNGEMPGSQTVTGVGSLTGYASGGQTLVIALTSGKQNGASPASASIGTYSVKATRYS